MLLRLTLVRLINSSSNGDDCVLYDNLILSLKTKINDVILLISQSEVRVVVGPASSQQPTNQSTVAPPYSCLEQNVKNDLKKLECQWPEHWCEREPQSWWNLMNWPDCVVYIPIYWKSLLAIALESARKIIIHRILWIIFSSDTLIKHYRSLKKPNNCYSSIFGAWTQNILNTLGKRVSWRES